MAQVPYSPVPSVGPSGQGLGYSRQEASAAASAQQVTRAIGGFATQWQELNDSNEKFTTLTSFNNFNSQMRQEAEELKRGAAANGDGAALGIMSRYTQREEEFMTTVPERLKPEYAARLAALRGSFEEDALNFQWNAIDAFQTGVLDQQANEAATALTSDPTQLDSWRANLNDFIDTSAFTPEAKTKLRASVEQRIEEATLKAVARQNPLAVGNFEQRLARKESSGRPGVVNQLGFAGLYQFGAPRMAELGMFTPEGSLDGWNQKKGGTEKWSGTFSIPGHPEVKTVQDFLQSPAAQRTAFQVHTQKMDAEIAERGLARFEGQEVGGVPITRQGLYAMIHLGGAQGAENALTGKGNAADANGSTVLDYARLGVGGDIGLVGDERFRNVPADRKLALVADGVAEYDAEVADAAKQAQIEHNERLNTLLVGLNDGRFGQADIDTAAKEGWLTDFDEINKAENVLRQNREKVGTEMEAISQLNNPAKVWDPTDSDDKKRNNVLFDAMGTAGRMAEMSDDAVNNELIPLVGRTGMIPAPAVGVLTAMSRSPNPQNVNWAFSKLDQLERTMPRAFDQDVNESMAKDLARWRTLREYMPPDKIAEEFAKSREPGALAAQERLKDEAEKLIKGVDTAEMVSDFDPGFFSAEPDLPRDDAQRSLFRYDYEQRFKEMWAVSGGDMDVARANTVALMKRDWNIDHTSGEARLMKYPPHMRYPAVDGSHEWMNRQLTEKFGPGAFLVPDQQTAEEWSRGAQAPSYKVVRVNELGMPEAVLPGDQRVQFDTKAEIAKAQRELVEAEALARYNNALLNQRAGRGPVDPKVKAEAERVEAIRQERRVGQFKSRNNLVVR